MLISLILVNQRIEAFSDSEMITVRNKLSAELINKIRRRKIRFVQTDLGVDRHLFDDQTLFPHLQTVTLKSGSELNSALLFTLSTKYPRIRELTLVQDEPLQDASLATIESFKRLRFLDLECDLQNPKMFQKAVPSGVSELLIGGKHANSWIFSALPNLAALRIYNAQVDSKFLNSLTLPNLRYLYLGAEVSKDCYPALARYKNLKTLIVEKAHAERDDIKLLHGFGIRVVNVYAASNKVGQPQN